MSSPVKSGTAASTTNAHHQGGGGGGSNFRVFIALFDYDPAKMSPNTDSCQEELPFREGDLIKVYGEQDDDGFFYGELHERRGFIPCNMVSEVQVDDPEVVKRLLSEKQQQQSSSSQRQQQQQQQQQRVSSGSKASSSSNPKGNYKDTCFSFHEKTSYSLIIFN